MDVDKIALLDELFKDHPDKEKDLAEYFKAKQPKPKPLETDDKGFMDRLGNVLFGE